MPLKPGNGEIPSGISIDPPVVPRLFNSLPETVKLHIPKAPML